MENQIKDIELSLEDESKDRIDDFKSKLIEAGFADSSQDYKVAIEAFEEHEKSFIKSIMDMLSLDGEQ